jgi:hypothetical protein
LASSGNQAHTPHLVFSQEQVRVFIVLVLLLALLAGLASVALLLGALYFVWGWYTGELVAAAWLAAAGAALLWSVLGRHIVLLLHRTGTDDPQRHGPGEYLSGVRGCTLHVETEGPAAAPVLVLTHGWGFDASAWYRIRRQLRADFRLLLWDLPGLGGSSSFSDGAYDIERFAENLHLLIRRAGGAGRPQHRRHDDAHLLPSLPGLAWQQGQGARPHRHDLHHARSNDRRCRFPPRAAEAARPSSCASF